MRIHDRQREQVVAGEEARRFLLVGVGLHRQDVAAHHLRDGRVRARGQQRTQVQDAQQLTVLIGHVEVERPIGVRRRLPQLAHGVRDREVRRDGDDLPGHPAAGGVLRIGQE